MVSSDIALAVCRADDDCNKAPQQHAMLLDWCTRVGCSFPAPAGMAAARPSLWQGATSAMQPAPEATAKWRMAGM